MMLINAPWYFWLFIGILVYNIIGTIIFFATKENDNVSARFTLGFLNVLWLIAYLFVFLYKKIKNRFLVRSVIEDKKTQTRYNCDHKYYDDFVCYSQSSFKGVSRTAYRKIWQEYPAVTKEMIAEVTRHCDYCKYNGKECTDDGNPLCKHNCWGEVEEYDKFERK